MKRIGLLFMLLLLLGITSCKKKATPTSTTPPATSTSSSLPFSVMQTSYNYADNGTTVTLDSNVLAVFMQNPFGINPTVFIPAGNVSLNDSNLYFWPNNYVKMNPINISQALKWQVTGSGTITAFTHSYIPSYPKFSGGSLLPDTCVKANGITINVSGVTNLSSTTGFVAVTVSQSSLTYLSKQIFGNGTVTFSPSEISGFNTNANVSLELIFQNSKTETLGGVIHSFNNNVWYNKTIYLK